MPFRFKRSLSFALIALISFSVSPANGANLSGTTCSKAGATKTVSNKKFTCIKSGKKLIWNKGVVVKQSTPTTSAEVQLKLGARMANIVSVQMLGDKLYSNSQGLKVEDPTAKTMKSTTIIAQIAAAKMARQMIMSFSPMFPNFDLNDFPREVFTYTNPSMAPAHGTFHLAQDFFAQTAGGIDAKLIPTWFSEGSASLFATMVASEISKKNPNYATLAASNTGDWSKEMCQLLYEKWRIDNSAEESTVNTCASGLGQIMHEVLVSKTNALDKILLVYQMVAIGNSFDDAFAFAYEAPKSDFFKEIDALLVLLKW